MKASSFTRCCAALFLFAALLFSMQASAATTVRVGFYPLPGFQEVRADGSRSGYSYEYLQEIAQLSDWKLEFVDVPWKTALDMLARGELDVLGGVQRSPERESRMLFSRLDSGSSSAGIYVRATDKRFAADDYAALQGKKLGTINGALHNGEILRRLAQQGVSAELVPFATDAELDKALHDGVVDGALFTKLTLPRDVAVVLTCPPAPRYFAVRPHGDTVLAALDKAMELLQSRDQNYNLHLYEKYFAYQPRMREAFSLAEQEYIAKRAPVTVVYDPDWAPLEYRDPESGEFRGVVAEIFKRISTATGLTFSFVPTRTFSESLRHARDGDVALVSTLYRDHAWAQRNNVRLTSRTLFTYSVIIGERERLGNVKTYALPRDYYLAQEIASRQPEKNFLYYDSIRECLDALLAGKADATLADYYVAEYLLRIPTYSHFSSLILENMRSAQAIGVSLKENPLLISILNKGLQSIPPEEITTLCLGHSLRRPAISLTSLLQLYPTECALALGGLLAFMVLVLCLMLRQKTLSMRRVEHLYYRDALLEQGNYHQFLRDAPVMLARHSTARHALVYLDIDEFKFINDAYGYDAGDTVLKLTAAALRQQLRQDELFARIHSDHFIVLLRHADERSLDERMGPLVHALEQVAAQWGRNAAVIYRAGVCLLESGRLKAEALQLAADKANYAKNSLRPQHKTLFAYYDHTIMLRLQEEKDMEQHMEQALRDNEFVPYIQPKVDISTGAIVGAELLTRWRHDGCLLPPARFIPLFERNGFIPELDMRMYEHLCRIQQERLHAGLPVFPISCNISYTLFIQEDFPFRVKQLADRYGVPTRLLELELTETMIAANPELVQHRLVQLHHAGFPLSMDDFGSGYSSVALLQKVRVDVLKLDKEFVQKGLDGPLERDLVRCLVQAAQNNSIQVVCEGIETQQQADFIRQLGCGIAQGFLYYRPMPEEEFTSLTCVDVTGTGTAQDAANTANNDTANKAAAAQ